VKPVETGCELDDDDVLFPADAQRLQYFSSCSEPLESICPCRCYEPLAPAVALSREGREIDLARVNATVMDIIQRHDVTLVEGAGGLLVPVFGSVTFVDLAREWRLPLIVVVGNKLGALNHAQLTVNWARQAGLNVTGYVVNTLSAKCDVAARTNVDVLADLLGAPLGVLPWLGAIACTEADRSRLAEVARQSLDIPGLLGRA